MSEIGRCGSCRFWSGYKTEDARNDYIHGMCRRHAPIVVESNYRGSGETVWPKTEGRDGCGDFVRELPGVTDSARPSTPVP